MYQNVLASIITFPILFFIPGYLFQKIIPRSIQNLTFLERFLIQTITSMIIVGWCALLLSEIGYFTMLNLFLIIISIILIFFIIFIHRKFRKSKSFSMKSFRPHFSINRRSLLFIIILAVGLLLFFRPGESITLNQDDVVIVNHAVNIAENGIITAYDPIFLQTIDKDLFYYARPHPFYEYLQFPYFGFYVPLDTGIVTFQYLDFYPILLSIFYSLFGLEYFLYLTPVITLFSLGFLYATLKRILDAKVAVLAVFLLAFNFAQIWFSRYPGVEMFTQMLIFAGVLALTLFISSRSPYYAILSALFFGTLLMVRVDSLLTAGSILLVFIILIISKRIPSRLALIFSVTFLLLNFWSSLHIYHFDKQYFNDQFMYSARIIGVNTLSLNDSLFYYTLPSILLFIFCIISYRKNISLNWKMEFKHIKFKTIRLISTVTIAVSFFFLYIQRYLISNGIISPRQTPFILQWFLTPIGLLFSVIGFIWIVNNKILTSDLFRNDKRLSLLSYLMIAIPHVILLYFISIRNQPVFPWAFRRFIPVILPFFVITLSYALIKLIDYSFSKPALPPRQILRKIGSIVIISTIIIPMTYINVDSGILTHTEFEGLIDQTKEFSNHFDENSIIIFHNPDYFTGIAVPMKHIFHRNTILMEHLTVNQSVINEIQSWKNRGYRVFIVTNQLHEITSSPLRSRIGYYFSYNISITKMEYVTSPPLISKPYGKISTVNTVLQVYEIH